MYQLAQPRHDGPLRRRWRNRQGWRRPGLSDRLGVDISRSDVSRGPDWPTVVEDAVLRQDMEWLLPAGGLGDLAAEQQLLGPEDVGGLGAHVVAGLDVCDGERVADL